MSVLRFARARGQRGAAAVGGLFFIAIALAVVAAAETRIHPHRRSHQHPHTWQLQITEGISQQPPSFMGGWRSGLWEREPNRPLLIVHGGGPFVGWDTTTQAIWAFDVAANRWIDFPTTGGETGSRYYHGMCIMENKMYVMGGQEPPFGGLENDWANPNVLDLETGVWSSFATTGTAPSTRFGHTMVCDSENQQIFVFGGRGIAQNSYLNDMHRLDVATSNWTPLSPAANPTASAHHAFHVDPENGVLHLYGGEIDQVDSNPVASSQYYTFSFADEEWTQQPAGLRPSQWGTLFVHPVDPSLLVLMTGVPVFLELNTYDLLDEKWETNTSLYWFGMGWAAIGAHSYVDHLGQRRAIALSTAFWTSMWTFREFTWEGFFKTLLEAIITAIVRVILLFFYDGPNVIIQAADEDKEVLIRFNRIYEYEPVSEQLVRELPIPEKEWEVSAGVNDRGDQIVAWSNSFYNNSEINSYNTTVEVEFLLIGENQNVEFGDINFDLTNSDTKITLKIYNWGFAHPSHMLKVELDVKTTPMLETVKVSKTVPGKHTTFMLHSPDRPVASVRFLHLASVDSEFVPLNLGQALNLTIVEPTEDPGDGSDIDAKYNSSTTLRMELAFPSFERELVYDPDVSLLVHGDQDGSDDDMAVVYVAVACSVGGALLLLAAAAAVAAAIGVWRAKRQAAESVQMVHL